MGKEQNFNETDNRLKTQGFNEEDLMDGRLEEDFASEELPLLK